MSNFKKVVDFNVRCGNTCEKFLNLDKADEVIDLALRLVNEEVEEFNDAAARLKDAILCDEKYIEHYKNTIKELCDVLYVVYGAGHLMGIEVDEYFDEVHTSNMSKLVDGKCVRDEEGKILKGPDYEVPEFMQ